MPVSRFKSSAITELSIAVSRKARARFTAVLSSGRRGWPILRSQRAPQRVRQPCDDCREDKRIESAGERLERLGQHGGGSRVLRDCVGDERRDRADAERGTDQHRVDIKHPVGEARHLPSG
jgi:hypothetical protein